MNERIEKLAMQANSHHDNFFDLNYKELDAFLEKFAELIVKECADISEVSFHNGSAGYLAILNYFGVEQ